MFNVVEPIRSIKKFRYRCDNKFHHEYIENEVFQESKAIKDNIGIIIVSGSDCQFYKAYKLKTKVECKLIDTLTVRKTKAHKRGGQSQNRIARLREEYILHYVKKINEKLEQLYSVNGSPIIRKLVISGSKDKIVELKKYIQMFDYSMVSHGDIESIANEAFDQEQKLDTKEYIKQIRSLFVHDIDKLLFGPEIKEYEQEGHKLEIIYKPRSDLTKYESTYVELDDVILEEFGGLIGKKF